MKDNKALLATCREELELEKYTISTIGLKENRPLTDEEVERVDMLRRPFLLEEQAALLALQRKDEEHEREMEVFESILKELTSIYSVHDTDRERVYGMDTATHLKKEYVVWGKVRKLLTKFRGGKP